MACDTVKFNWMETVHTNVIYVDDGRLDCPHHLTIPAVARIDQYASAQACCVFVSMYQQMLHLYLKFLLHQLYW